MENMLNRRYLVLILFLILPLFSIIYQFSVSNKEESLKVWIEGQMFYDSEFNETYDYSQLWYKKVFFRERLNSSEFATGDSPESMELVFNDLDEVCQFLKELGVPNIVVYFTKFMGNGTFEEVYMKIHNNQLPRPESTDYAKWLGDFRNGVFYEVRRTKTSRAGLIITKFYNLQETNNAIWTLAVGDYYQLNNPPFKSKFTRFPK